MQRFRENVLHCLHLHFFEGLGFKNEIYLKSSSPELLDSGACNLVCSIAWWSFTKSVQTKVPESKMAPRQGVLGSNHRKA